MFAAIRRPLLYIREMITSINVATTANQLIPGIFRITGDVWPLLKPSFSDPLAFAAKLIHELVTSIKFRTISHFVRGRFFHLDRAHGHMLVIFPKFFVLVELVPSVDR